MARVNFKTSLSASRIPFLHTQAPTGAILPSTDVQNRTSGAQAGSQQNVDYNVIETAYGHNVLPTQQGYVSLGFDEAVTGIVDAYGDEFYNDVIALFHPHGSAGGTAWYDNSKYGHAVTVTPYGSGSATIVARPDFVNKVGVYMNSDLNFANRTDFKVVPAGFNAGLASRTTWTLDVTFACTAISRLFDGQIIAASKEPTFGVQNQGGWQLWQNSYYMRFEMYTATGAIAIRLEYSFAPVQDTRYKVRITRSGSTLRLFINGTLVLTSSTWTGTPADGSYATYLAGPFVYNGTPVLTGVIEEFRITENQVRSSANYSVETLPFPDSATNTFVDVFDRALVISDEGNNAVVLAPADGRNYTYRADGTTWLQNSGFDYGRTAGLITTAYINGQTYVCYEGARIQAFDFVTGTWQAVTLQLPATLDMAQVRGIFALENYLCIFTRNTLYWSTLTNVLDFATTAQGAGSGVPNDIRGSIVTVLPVVGGAIIHTTENAVSVRTTNQSDRPFLFAEVSGSLGIASDRHVTNRSADEYHYLLGRAGLQRVSIGGSEPLFPAAADFLCGKVYDLWLESSGAPYIVRFPTASVLRTAVTMLAGRYLACSYGDPDSRDFTGAIVFDMMLMRWGRVVMPHRDIVELPVDAPAKRYGDLMGTQDTWTNILAEGTKLSDWFPQMRESATHRTNIALLQGSGALQVLKTGGTEGKLMLGRVQLVRGKGVTFHEALMEGGSSATLEILGSYSGAAREISRIATASSVGYNYSTWNARVACTNFDLAIRGSFDLVQVALSVQPHVQRTGGVVPLDPVGGLP